jgi:hypothetical protein
MSRRLRWLNRRLSGFLRWDHLGLRRWLRRDWQAGFEGCRRVLSQQEYVRFECNLLRSNTLLEPQMLLRLAMAVIAQIARIVVTPAMLLALAALAAEPTGTLTLACEGTLTDVHSNLPAVSASKRIIVDFTERTVKGFGVPIDKVEVSSVSEALITFGGPNTDAGWTFQGSIDRVTGDLEAMGTLRGPRGIVGVMVYSLKCKPAQRMF